MGKCLQEVASAIARLNNLTFALMTAEDIQKTVLAASEILAVEIEQLALNTSNLAEFELATHTQTLFDYIQATSIPGTLDLTTADNAEDSSNAAALIGGIVGGKHHC